MEIIRPLVRNMRDVRRYAAALHGTVRALEGKVSLVDVLALEAVRVFLPDVFQRMHAAVDGLTTPSGRTYGGGDEPPYLKAHVESLVQAAGERAEVVRSLVRRLFLAAERHVGGSNYGSDWLRTWARERRVAHEDFLRLYLERVVGEGLQAITDAEQGWALMEDKDSLDAFLRSLPVERLQDVISALEAYEDEYAPPHVVPAATVLLNLMPELPDRQRRMFELDTRMVVTRVVYRLLKCLDGKAAVEDAVRQILPSLSSLSSKLELINDVGYREGRGHELASEAASAQFELDWRHEVRAATLEQLVGDSDLLRVLFVARRESEPGEPSLDIDDSRQMTLAMLRAAHGFTRSQTLGRRAVKRSPRLAWDVLTELYGSENVLRQRIESLKASSPDDVGDLLSLAEKYLSGWRPEDDELDPEVRRVRRERVGSRFRWRAAADDPGMVGVVVRLDDRSPMSRVIVEFSSPEDRTPSSRDYETPTSLEWKDLTMPVADQRHRTAHAVANSDDDNDGWVEFERLSGEDGDSDHT